MVFQRAGRIEQTLRRERTSDGFIESQTGDRCGGAAAEPGFRRYFALDIDFERREHAAVLAGDETERAFDIVFAVERAFELKMQFVVARAAADTKTQIKLDRDRQCVEPGTEVRDRSGYADFEMVHFWAVDIGLCWCLMM